MDGILLAAHANQAPAPDGLQQSSGLALLMAVCNHLIFKRFFSATYHTFAKPFTVTVNYLTTLSSASAVNPSLDTVPAIAPPPFLTGYSTLPPSELHRLAIVHSGLTSIIWQTPAEHVKSIEWDIMVAELLAAEQAYIDELRQISGRFIEYNDFEGMGCGYQDPPDATSTCPILELSGDYLEIIPLLCAFLRRHIGSLGAVSLSILSAYLTQKYFQYLEESVCEYVLPEVTRWAHEVGRVVIELFAVMVGVAISHEICDSFVTMPSGKAALDFCTATLALVPSAVYTAVCQILFCAISFTLLCLVIVTVLSSLARLQLYDPNGSPPVVTSRPSVSLNPSTAVTPLVDGGFLSRETSTCAVQAVTGSSLLSADKAATGGTAKVAPSKVGGLPRKMNTYRAPSMDSDSDDSDHDDGKSDVSTARTSDDESSTAHNAMPVMINRQTSPPPMSRMSPELHKKPKEELQTVAHGWFEDDISPAPTKPLTPEVTPETSTTEQDISMQHQPTTPVPAPKVQVNEKAEEESDGQWFAPCLNEEIGLSTVASASLPQTVKRDDKPAPEPIPSQSPASPSAPTNASSGGQAPAPAASEPSHAAPAEDSRREKAGARKTKAGGQKAKSSGRKTSSGGRKTKSGHISVSISPAKVDEAMNNFRFAGGKVSDVTKVLFAGLGRLNQACAVPGDEDVHGATIVEIEEEIQEEIEEEIEEEEESAPAPPPFVLPSNRVQIEEEEDEEEDEVRIEVAAARPLRLILPAPASPVIEVAIWQPTDEKDKEVIVEVSAVGSPDDTRLEAARDALPDATRDVAADTLTLTLSEDVAQPLAEKQLTDKRIPAASAPAAAIAPEDVPLPASPVQGAVELTAEAEPTVIDVNPKDIPLPASPVQGPVELLDEVEPIVVAEAETVAEDIKTTAPAEEELPADVLVEEAPADVAVEESPADFPVEEAPADVAVEAAVSLDDNVNGEALRLVAEIEGGTAEEPTEDEAEEADAKGDDSVRNETETTQSTLPSPTSASAPVTSAQPTETPAGAPVPMTRPNKWHEILLAFPSVPLKFEGLDLEVEYQNKAQREARRTLRNWVTNAMKKRAKMARKENLMPAASEVSVSDAVASSSQVEAPASSSTPTPSPTPAATTSVSTPMAPETETDTTIFTGQRLPAASVPAAATAPEDVPLPALPEQGRVELLDEVEPIVVAEAETVAEDIKATAPVSRTDLGLNHPPIADVVSTTKAEEELPADVLVEEAPADVAVEESPADFPVEEAPADVAVEAAVSLDDNVNGEALRLAAEIEGVMAEEPTEDEAEEADAKGDDSVRNETETTQSTLPSPTSASAPVTSAQPTETPAGAPVPMTRPNKWHEILLAFPSVPLKFEGLDLEVEYQNKAQREARRTLRNWVTNAMKKRAKMARKENLMPAASEVSVSDAVASSSQVEAPASSSTPTPSPAPAATTSVSTPTTSGTDTDTTTSAGQELLPSSNPVSSSTPFLTGSGKMAVDQLLGGSDDGGWETVVAGKRCVRAGPTRGTDMGMSRSAGGSGSRSYFAALDEARSSASEASDEERSGALSEVEAETGDGREQRENDEGWEVVDSSALSSTPTPSPTPAATTSVSTPTAPETETETTTFAGQELLPSSSPVSSSTPFLTGSGKMAADQLLGDSDDGGWETVVAGKRCVRAGPMRAGPTRGKMAVDQLLGDSDDGGWETVVAGKRCVRAGPTRGKMAVDQLLGDSDDGGWETVVAGKRCVRAGPTRGAGMGVSRSAGGFGSRSYFAALDEARSSASEASVEGRSGAVTQASASRFDPALMRVHDAPSEPQQPLISGRIGRRHRDNRRYR